MSLRISQLHGFNVAKSSSSGIFWAGNRSFVVDGNIDSNVFNVAAGIWGDVNTIPYNYTITAINTFHSGLYWGVGWAVGCSFSLINQGSILGLGGNGADVVSAVPSMGTGNGHNGAPGGNALNLAGHNVSIDNGAGNIWSGGGGGGAGGSAWFDEGNAACVCCGGAGGGGQGGMTTTAGNSIPNVTLIISGLYDYVLSQAPRAGAGVNFQGGGPTDFIELVNALGTISHAIGAGLTDSVTISVLSIDATSGSDIAAGAGGVGSSASGSETPPTVSFLAVGGLGGDGGNFGEAGHAGGNATATGPYDVVHGTGGLGGAAGLAIFLDGGTAIFLAGNNPAQVKGSIA